MNQPSDAPTPDTAPSAAGWGDVWAWPLAFGLINLIAWRFGWPFWVL